MATLRAAATRRTIDKKPHRRLYSRSPYGLGAWWALFRGEHGMITLIAVIVSEMLVSGRFGYGQLFPALGPLLITWGAFGLNDYFGLVSDRALKRRDRPLVAGRLTKSEALAGSLALLFAGLAFTWPVNLVAFSIASVYVFGSLIYDVFLKRFPFIGNLFIASTMAVPFLYGNAVISNDWSFSTFVLALAGVAFFAGLGRELLKTLADVKGDRKLHAHTLPMYVGAVPTVWLAALFSLVAVLLSLIPLAGRFSAVYAFLITASNIAILASVELSMESQQERVLRRCRNYSLAGMAIGVFAFGALALGL